MLAGWAAAHDLARLAWRSEADAPIEPLAARRPVQVTIAGMPVALPPGAFLQASAAAEAAIGAAVAAALGAPAGVADLYAGCGALGLPFAHRDATVAAFEADLVGAVAFREFHQEIGIERHFAVMGDVGFRHLAGHAGGIELVVPAAGERVGEEDALAVAANLDQLRAARRRSAAAIARLVAEMKRSGIAPGTPPDRSLAARLRKAEEDQPGNFSFLLPTGK